jgi:hypothetical protein
MLWRGTWGMVILQARWWWQKRPEVLCLWLARRMPHYLRYWATIVSCGEATTGEYGSTLVTELRMMEMLERVGKRHGRRQERERGGRRT